MTRTLQRSYIDAAEFDALFQAVNDLLRRVEALEKGRVAR